MQHHTQDFLLRINMKKIKEAFERYKKTGEINILSEGRWDDIEQISTGGADYSSYSTDSLKAMLEPGALHGDEQGFKRLIRAELKRRTKGKGK